MESRRSRRSIVANDLAGTPLFWPREAEWNGVGGSAGHASAIPLGFARGFGKTRQAFSKSARSGATPVISVNVKRQNRVIFPL